MNDADAPEPKIEFAGDLAEVSVDVQKRDVEGYWAKKSATINLPEGFEVLVLGYDSPTIKALRRALVTGRDKSYGEDDAKTEERNLYENQRVTILALKGWRARTLDGRLLPVAPFLGEAIPYSESAKKRLLCDDRLRKFLVAVMRAMNEADEVALDWERSAGKNSGPGSAANSDAAPA